MIPFDHLWVEFVVSFSPCSRVFFSADNLVFPFPQKPTLAIPNSKCYWEMVDEELICEYATIIQSHLFIIFITRQCRF